MAAIFIANKIEFNWRDNRATIVESVTELYTWPIPLGIFSPGPCRECSSSVKVNVEVEDKFIYLGGLHRVGPTRFKSKRYYSNRQQCMTSLIESSTSIPGSGRA